MCAIEYTDLFNQQSLLEILRGVDKEFVLSTRRVSESSHLIKDQNKTEKSRNRQTIRKKNWHVLRKCLLHVSYNFECVSTLPCARSCGDCYSWIIHLIFTKCTVIEMRFGSQKLSVNLTTKVQNIEFGIEIQTCSTKVKSQN